MPQADMVNSNQGERIPTKVIERRTSPHPEGERVCLETLQSKDKIPGKSSDPVARRSRNLVKID
jgi:hypothetical protein